jgi:hypothetical protein
MDTVPHIQTKLTNMLMNICLDVSLSAHLHYDIEEKYFILKDYMHLPIIQSQLNFKLALMFQQQFSI